MPIIYIETDNSDPENKLFIAKLAGAAAAKAEAKMEAAVKGVFFKKTPGFTTEKKQGEQPKGYFIRLTVSKIEPGGGKTKCSLKGEIVRYPKQANVKGDTGEIMVSTSMTGSGYATGTSPDSIADVAEAIAEDLARKSVPFMRIDWEKR